MKDKHGKEINTIGQNCTADVHIAPNVTKPQLGTITEIRETDVAVLLLNDGGQTCHEEIFLPEHIALI